MTGMPCRWAVSISRATPGKKIGRLQEIANESALVTGEQLGDVWGGGGGAQDCDTDPVSS